VFTVAALTPAEAITGIPERLVEFRAVRACADCAGQGVDLVALRRAPRCFACSGRGRVATRRWAGIGGGSEDDDDHQLASATLRRCPACGGRGLATPPPACATCAGEGLAAGGGAATQRLRVRVPAGVCAGQVLRVRGQGNDALFRKGEDEDEEDEEGGEGLQQRVRRRRGDLYVRLDVRSPRRAAAAPAAAPPSPSSSSSSSTFRRVPGTHDVASELRLPLFDALLGAEVAVETALGPRRLRVPPGTQHGARLALRGHGVPRSNSDGNNGAGDHVFTVVVVVPRLEEPDKEEEEGEQEHGEARRLLQQLSRRGGGGARRRGDNGGGGGT
jgi:molecular chaperone DnaJ